MQVRRVQPAYFTVAVPFIEKQRNPNANEYIVAEISTTVSTDTMFTYFFVAVLQSSYLCLLLCCCFAVLHLAFASDPARFTSVLRMSLVLTPQTPPSPVGARGRGTRLQLCLVDWFGNEKRGRYQYHMTYCLATSPKSTQILPEILPLALLLKIEAGTFYQYSWEIVYTQT